MIYITNNLRRAKQATLYEIILKTTLAIGNSTISLENSKHESFNLGRQKMHFLAMFSLSIIHDSQQTSEEFFSSEWARYFLLEVPLKYSAQCTSSFRELSPRGGAKRPRRGCQKTQRLRDACPHTDPRRSCHHLHSHRDCCPYSKLLLRWLPTSTSIVIHFARFIYRNRIILLRLCCFALET